MHWFKHQYQKNGSCANICDTIPQKVHLTSTYFSSLIITDNGIKVNVILLRISITSTYPDSILVLRLETVPAQLCPGYTNENAVKGLTIIHIINNYNIRQRWSKKEENNLIHKTTCKAAADLTLLPSNTTNKYVKNTNTTILILLWKALNH